MELGDLLGYALALLWLLGPLLRRKQPKLPPAEAGAPPVVSPARLAGRVADELAALEAEAERAVAALDPAIAARLGPLLPLPQLRASRERLTAMAGEGGIAGLIDELERAQRNLPSQRDAIRAVAALAARRADPELAELHTAADRFVAEVYEPFAAFAQREIGELQIGPPLPVVWESRGDEPLARAPFAAALLPVPRAVRLQPWLWPSLGHSFGRYLQGAVPELRREVHEALELDLREPPSGSESPELARLLFGAWSGTLLADVAGALAFGPAYLQMLSRAFAEEDPRAVTTIALGRGGEVRPEPPPHVRAHVVGHWVAQMGHESTALELLRAWDANHDHPDALPLSGPGGSGAIPAGPLLAHLEGLLDRLDAHAFESLGHGELGDIPGLAGWNGVSGRARQAERSLAEGTSLPGISPRALLAGAAAAAIAAPQQVATIDRALHASFAGVERRRPRAPRTATRRAPIPTDAPARAGRSRLSPRRLTEALVLGDVLLQPRSRTRLGRPV